MPAILGLIGPAMSMGGGLMGMLNGGTSQNVHLPPQWQMQGMDQAAGGAMQGIQDLLKMNVPAQLMPAYGQVANDLMNNQGAQGALTGAGLASGYGFNAAGQAANSGNYLTQLGTMLPPFSMAAMNAGFDPQKDLFSRTQHNVLEGSRAANEARGIDNSPYGAGLENDAMRNFNIDWQNNQLQRMVQGLGAGASGFGMAGNLMNQGSNLSGAASNLAMDAGMFPYRTFNQIGGDRLSALNSLSQAGMNATQLGQQGVQNYLQYIGTGNQANQVQNQGAGLGLQQARDTFGQQQQFGNQFGQGMAGLSNGLGKMYGWGGQGGGSGGGNFGWGNSSAGASNFPIYGPGY